MLSSAALSLLLCLVVTVANSSVCPNLNTAANYAVVTYAGVTNAHVPPNTATLITGNVAVAPISSVTGFPPGVITGTTQLGTAAAKQAVADVITTYNYCQRAAYTKDLTATSNLAGQTLTPGVYKFTSTAAISAAGTLTLKGAGIYIFQVGSAMTTGAGAKIVVENGARAGCIYWAVGTSVTHGASSIFIGNILAGASVTFGANVKYHGSVYAETGDVTLIDDSIIQEAKCTFC